jgi:hypothetical protein
MVFWHVRRGATRREDSDAAPPAPAEWPEAAVSEEVVALLAGRVVDYYTAIRQEIPPWAALNRLAHADRTELFDLVARRVPAGVARPWSAAELLIAARLLVQARTPDDLRRVQQGALVPLELLLVDRWRPERLGPDEVLDAAVDALGTFPT